VSQKAEGPGRASHYVSFPRLAVSGTINSREVSGTAWMDHEWFTEQLAPDQVGWDWFSVQLDNHTELMLFQLRRKDGCRSTRIHPVRLSMRAAWQDICAGGVHAAAVVVLA
jgi:predicted secreted hydrolase